MLQAFRLVTGKENTKEMSGSATIPLLVFRSRCPNNKCRKVHSAVWSQQGKQTFLKSPEDCTHNFKFRRRTFK